MVIDYNRLEDEIFELLGDGSTMQLAIIGNHRVLTKNMNCLVYNRRIYFRSDEDFVSGDNMTDNPNVALSVNNVQMEGLASIKSDFDEEQEIAERYRKLQNDTYDTCRTMCKPVLVEVEPTFITMWKYENGHPLRDYLDLRKKTAYRELCDTAI